MTITDEAKLFAVRQQLIESQRNLHAAIKIINYVFDRDVTPAKLDADNDPGDDPSDGDPITGLYAGQLPEVQIPCEEPEVESEECIE